MRNGKRGSSAALADRTHERNRYGIHLHAAISQLAREYTGDGSCAACQAEHGKTHAQDCVARNAHDMVEFFTDRLRETEETLAYLLRYGKPGRKSKKLMKAALAPNETQKSESR